MLWPTIHFFFNYLALLLSLHFERRNHLRGCRRFILTGAIFLHRTTCWLPTKRRDSVGHRDVHQTGGTKINCPHIINSFFDILAYTHFTYVLDSINGPDTEQLRDGDAAVDLNSLDFNNESRQRAAIINT